VNSSDQLIRFTFDISDTGLQAHLDRMPIEVRARLLPTIESLTQRLLVSVRAAEPVKTGALRAATRSYVDSGQNFIRGSVRVGPQITGKHFAGASGHNVAAAALEYGVHAVEHVAAHRMRLGHIFSRQSNQFVMVNAYTRRVNISARRFLRDPFERIRPIAEAEIRRVLEEKLEP
jgi:hypothetical protein